MPGETATNSTNINLTVESIEASGSTYNIFDDKELVGMVDAENESATRLARNSMDSVLDRIHEFRLRKENKGFNENNISLQVNLNELNQDYQEIVQTFANHAVEIPREFEINPRFFTKDTEALLSSKRTKLKKQAGKFYDWSKVALQKYFVKS